MDHEPDYSRYTLDELLDVKEHIDRQKYPERVQKLDDEIARRYREASEVAPHLEGVLVDKASGENPPMPESPPELSVNFLGSAREYFRIWIVNLCLTLLTFGIFSAWAKVRKKRYLYSHTIVGGTPFQYLGQPVPILKGRLIVGIGFLVYYVSNHFITSLLPYVLAAGVIVAPWVMIRSAAFNARYSAFRNMTFHFDGGYLDALKVLYVWGIIPVFVIAVLVMGMMFKWRGTAFVAVGAVSVFFFAFPWWIKSLKNFIIEHTSYGGEKGDFSATGSQFFSIYFVSGLILFAVGITVGVLSILFFPFKKSLLLGYLMAIPIYGGYVVAYAYVKARSGNLVWNNTRLGPLRFQSTLRCWGLIKLYVGNALGILSSLGLLIPWAVMRTLKYRADNMWVVQEGALGEFQGSDRSMVAAVGAETMDIFDVDLSL